MSEQELLDAIRQAADLHSELAQLHESRARLLRRKAKWHDDMAKSSRLSAEECRSWIGSAWFPTESEVQERLRAHFEDELRRLKAERAMPLE